MEFRLVFYCQTNPLNRQYFTNNTLAKASFSVWKWQTLMPLMQQLSHNR